MANEKLVALEHLKDILPLFEDGILDKINELLPQSVEPAHDDIPSLFIKGEMPEAKTYVPMEMEYVSKTDKFHSYIYAKLQGTSSLEHPKKNLTVVFYEDEARSNGLYKDFKGWGKANKFVLKADYTDILHARNVVCAKLWSKVVASRPDYDSLPEELKNSPNNGAIDGFPVKVYVNSEYQGLYSFTIPKGAWQFGLNESNPDHALIGAEINDNGDADYERNPCNFSEVWRDADTYHDAWEIEVGSDKTQIRALWNMIYTAINFGEANIEDYLDVQSAIDYFIFQDIILGTDGLAKNMLMVTYDMAKWYLSAYDMDATFDLSWEGELLDCCDVEMPDYPYLNNYSQLLQFLWDNYWDEMVERYFELRNSVLSEAAIISEFENYINIYGEDVYIQDAIPYPDIPNATENNLSRLKTFAHSRLEFLDNYYGGEE